MAKNKKQFYVKKRRFRGNQHTLRNKCEALPTATTPTQLSIAAASTAEEQHKCETLPTSLTPPPLLIAAASTSGEQQESTLVQGRRIVQFQHLMDQICIANIHPGPFECNFNNMSIVGEHRVGLKSHITLKCSMCSHDAVLVTDIPTPKMDVNTSAVAGAIAVGVGHNQVEEIMAAMDIPFLSEYKFRCIETEIGSALRDTALQSMENAAKKEAELAIECGDIDDLGVPLISVYADGTWAKRSYKTKYNSLSGAAAIIGCKTKEVLFLGVKNKYCTMCARSERAGKVVPQHACYKNWSGTSTAMETAIVLEGFQRSVELYGIKYNKLISDGDSSVYHALVKNRPYGDLGVEKVECTNHLLRNFCRKLKNLTENKHAGPAKQRKLIASKTLKLRSAAKFASIHWHESEEHFLERANQLRKDILNSPYHIFGHHENCALYFCDRKLKEGEVDNVDDFKNSGLWEKLMEIVTSLANHSKSLVQRLTSNVVENFNNLVAKLTGGKRVNYTGRGSYSNRCMGAVLSHNSKKLISSLHRNMYHSSPGYYVKILEEKRYKKLKRERLRPKKKCKMVSISSKPDQDYGPLAHQQDMDEDDFEKLKLEYVSNLALSLDDLKNLEINTRDQAENSLWYEERRKRLTASNFGKVCKRKPTTSCEKLVKTLLYSTTFYNKAISYGKFHEKIAINLLEEAENIKVEPCGLFIDKKYPYLAATPDGVVDDESIVEIKCPYSARSMSLEDAIRLKKVQFYTTDSNGIRKINKKHDYYFQIQGQLHVCNKNKCYFVTYTNREITYEVVLKDDKFWEEMMEGKLKSFYLECILPEIVDPRHPRTMKIREATDFIEKSCLKKKREQEQIDNEKNPPKKRRLFL